MSSVVKPSVSREDLEEGGSEERIRRYRRLGRAGLLAGLLISLVGSLIGAIPILGLFFQSGSGVAAFISFWAGYFFLLVAWAWSGRMSWAEGAFPPVGTSLGDADPQRLIFPALISSMLASATVFLLGRLVFLAYELLFLFGS